MKSLARRGLLRGDADASNAPPSLSPAEALATAGMQRGTLLTVRESSDGATHDGAALAPLLPPRVSDAVTHERFNPHASVHLDAYDHLGRERLCRYLSRPAFSLARLRMRRDGNVSYRVKKASRGRARVPRVGAERLLQVRGGAELVAQVGDMFVALFSRIGKRIPFVGSRGPWRGRTSTRCLPSVHGTPCACT